MPVKGHSTQLHFGDADTYADSETWTQISGITEITPVNVEAEDVDVSSMDSPEQYDEFDPGWASASDVEATLHYEKEKQEDVLALFRVPKGYKTTFSDGSHWGFSGYLKAVGNEVERKGIVSLKVKFKISGKPVFVKAGA